jgi:hypothetical protein
MAKILTWGRVSVAFAVVALTVLALGPMDAYGISPAGVSVSPPTISAASDGAPYIQTFSASGGSTPYTFTLSTGTGSAPFNAVPSGLALSSTGVLSGTPTSGGSYSFTVTATDAHGVTGSQNYTLVVSPPTLTFSPTTLPNGATGVTYSQAIAASGGTGPYSNYQVSTGTGTAPFNRLPAGLTLSSTGVLSGTPTAGGSYDFIVSATDSSTGNGPYTGSQNYTLVVSPPTLTFSPTTLASAPVGVAYSQTITAAGGTGPYSNYQASTGTGSAPFNTVPAGLTLSSTGVLSGTPTAGGTYDFVVSATDSSTGNGPYTGSQNYSLIISSVSVSPTTLPNGANGVAYSQTITASGGTAPYTFSVGSGLPPGLTLTSAGLLSGVPTAAGPYAFTITATQGNGGAGSRNYRVTIAPAVAPSLSTLAVTGCQSYSLTMSTGAPGYSFAVTSGSLPAGLTLTSAGRLSGTATTAGTYSFTVSAALAGSPTLSRSYVMTVGLCVGPDSGVLPAGSAGTAYSDQLSTTGGTGPYRYQIEGGGLPPGLSLTSGGLISGTTGARGTFSVTIEALDSSNPVKEGTHTLTLTMT